METSFLLIQFHIFEFFSILFDLKHLSLVAPKHFGHTTFNHVLVALVAQINEKI